MSLAEATREEGNGHFKVGAFVLAERCYADALALLTAEATAVSAACAVVDDVTVIETICKPVADSTGAAAASEAIADASPASPFTITEVKCRLNRATCLLKLQGYAAALRESDAVLACVPVNAKAHYQRAQALRGITHTLTLSLVRTQTHAHSHSHSHTASLVPALILTPYLHPHPTPPLHPHPRPESRPRPQ